MICGNQDVGLDVWPIIMWLPNLFSAACIMNIDLRRLLPEHRGPLDSVFVTSLRSIGLALTSRADSSQSSPNSCLNFAQMTGREYIM
jgi:hypothetical protein